MGKLDLQISTSFKFDADKVRKSIAAELYQFGHEVMAVSQERVPVDTGALMNTGRVDEPVDSGSDVSVTLGYGGPSVDYALAVHEDMTKHHPRPGSGPKYLSGPTEEKAPELTARIADAFREGLQ